jgi:LPS sulfotransferase NodH
VHLERRDVLGQAISLVRALQTSQFRAHHTPQGEPRYDRAAINDWMVNLIRDQARWRFHFVRNGIEPVRLVYEDVIADPGGAVRAVVEALGLGGAFTADLSRIQVTVQRDAINEAWRRRFLAEASDPNVLS